MTSEMVKACVNSADLFICLCLTSTKKKLPSVCVLTLFSHLLHVSLFAVTIPSWKGCEHPHILQNAPSVTGKKRCPKMGFLLRASILLRPGTLQRQQRRFGPCQMPPEASAWPFISKEKRTEKIPSERPANFRRTPEKAQPAPSSIVSCSASPLSRFHPSYNRC